MTQAQVEHINVTVEDASRTAKRWCDLFGWKIRWEGSAMNGEGYTVHVGTDDTYIAVYSPKGDLEQPGRSTYFRIGGLNHIGLVVDDIGEMEKRIRDAGYKPHNHADYEPGKRFYFDDDDGIEIEIVSYN